LVIVISEESARTGPVVFEYYEKESSTKPKGIIHLCDAARICEVEEVDLQSGGKLLKKVSDTELFKVVTNDRTFPLRAPSSKERDDWVEALNETLGLSTSGAPKRRSIVPTIGDGSTGTFEVSCLTTQNQEILKVGAGGCLRISDGGMDLLATAGSMKGAGKWYWTELKSYGYVKQVVWVETGVDARIPGVTCFSSPDAETIWELVSQHMRKLGWESKGGARKFSRRSNMSWDSIMEPIGAGQGANQGPPTAPRGDLLISRTIQLYGKVVHTCELVVAGFGTALTDFTATKASELSMRAGDVFEVRYSCVLGEEEGGGGVIMCARRCHRIGSRTHSRVEASMRVFHVYASPSLALPPPPPSSSSSSSPSNSCRHIPCHNPEGSKMSRFLA
jgi:hypothetical protein